MAGEMCPIPVALYAVEFVAVIMDGNSLACVISTLLMSLWNGGH